MTQVQKSKLFFGLTFTTLHFFLELFAIIDIAIHVLATTASYSLYSTATYLSFLKEIYGKDLTQEDDSEHFKYFFIFTTILHLIMTIASIYLLIVIVNKKLASRLLWTPIFLLMSLSHFFLLIVSGFYLYQNLIITTFIALFLVSFRTIFGLFLWTFWGKLYTESLEEMQRKRLIGQMMLEMRRNELYKDIEAYTSGKICKI